ncbi:hypothetical protein ACQR1W_29160 [Bradyrhizobium sp. HKCCYLS1011]|uniref:hypothetical protein n=1 Tax=Bradyrhizobium sp. HKCCYLS1011 TaxID=3420733 RepID=UPI003EBBC40F
MNLTPPTSLDQLLSSPAFPMWLTLAAAAFFGLIVLVTLLRAEKSVANGALSIITLLAVGIAVASTMKSLDESGRGGTGENSSTASAVAMLPALACVEDLAGDLVLSNCEKNLFGTADATAAAVSYAGSMISRLIAYGDAAAANKAITPEQLALRRAVERDRYGLMAYVLLTRDRCTPADCYVFRLLTDSQQIVSNMEARTYEGLVTRYASQWNAPPQAQAPQAQPAASGAFAGLVPSMPTGKPTNAEFPSAASTPPVSIMAPEPTASTSRSAAPAAAAPAPRAPPSPAVAASHAQVPAKKPAPPKPKPPAVAPAPQAAPEAAEPSGKE